MNEYDKLSVNDNIRQTIDNEEHGSANEEFDLRSAANDQQRNLSATINKETISNEI